MIPQIGTCSKNEKFIPLKTRFKLKLFQDVGSLLQNNLEKKFFRVISKKFATFLAK